MVEVASVAASVDYQFEDMSALNQFMSEELKNKNVSFFQKTCRKSKSTGRRIHTRIVDKVEYAYESTAVYICGYNRESSCPCRLTVLKYLGLDTLFVEYDQTHSHKIGRRNVKNLKLSLHFREFVKSLINHGYSSQAIMKKVKVSDFGLRDRMMSRRELGVMVGEKEKEVYALHKSNDCESTQIWAYMLEEKGDLLYSDITEDKVEFAICTTFGRTMAGKYRKLMCLDGTHKTNKYDYSLFTIVTQDKYQQGIPVAYLISSNGLATTLTRFLTAFKAICPDIGAFMTDCCDAEKNAVETAYPKAKHLLCYWHVLKAWRAKLKQERNFEKDDPFWLKLKAFLKSRNNFEEEYKMIIESSSPKFADYLNTHYYASREKWAFSFRMNIPMFRFSNTNMLIEAFHNILKTQYLNGKVNRRVDRLVYKLTADIEEHYKDKQEANELGLNGLSSVAKAFKRESVKWKGIPDEFVSNTLEATIFKVKSVTSPDFWHTVDLFNDSCTCYINSVFYFCKHVFKCKGNNQVLNNVFEEDDLNFGKEIDWNKARQIPASSIFAPKSKKPRDTSALFMEVQKGLDANADNYELLVDINELLKRKNFIDALAPVKFVPSSIKIAPNQSNSGLTKHPFKFKKVKSKGRSKNTSK